MKKLFTLTILFSCLQLLPAKSIAQSLTFDIPEYTYYTSKQLTQKVFETLNHARTQPLDFLQKYRSELEKGQPKFIRILETSAPLDSILWDDGLAEMARIKVIQHNLNPDDIAHHKNCGNTSGSGYASPPQKNPLKYAMMLYTNINDPAYAYFGIFFSGNNENYCYYFGKTCDPQTYSFPFSGTVDTSEVKYKKIATADKHPTMTDAENQMVTEINMARYYPKVYAQIVARYLKNQGPIDKATYDAGMELIAELESMEPLSILEPMDCINEVAKSHGKDCDKRGFTAHEGSDGRMPNNRIASGCSKLKDGNENLTGGFKSPRQSNIELLLDAGISTRGHRYNLLNEKWEYVGCYYYESDNIPSKYQWIQNFGY